MSTELSNYLRFIRYFKPYWLVLGLITILLLLVTALKFTIPLAIMTFIDRVGKNAALSDFTGILAGLASLVVVAYLLRLLLVYLLNVIKEKILLKVQLALLLHIHNLPSSFFSASHTGYLISRLRSDIYAAQGLLADRFISLAMSVITFLLGTAFCFWINGRMAVFALLTLPLFTAAAVLPSRRIREMSAAIQERNAVVFKALEDSVAGVFVSKIFNRARWRARVLAHALSQEIRTKMRFTVFGNSVGQLSELISNLGVLALLAYGTGKIIDHSITIGQLMAFLSFYGFLFSSVGNVIGLNVELQAALGAIGRVYQILDQPAEPDCDRAGRALPSPMPHSWDRLEFDQVCFAYDGRAFGLRGVSFQAERGAALAIFGRTGAGKSTIVSLIPRYYDPQSGSISINGTDIRSLSRAALRERIAIATHTPFLFSGTIRDNITLGRRWVSDTQVEEAAAAASIHDFIASLPQGYLTQVGTGSLTLSTGQSQRIAIARLMLKDPELIVLDEALSGLDAECERQVLEALTARFGDRILITISHRLSTIQKSSRIVFIQDGCVAAYGPHEELLLTSPQYVELCRRQFVGRNRNPVASLAS